MIISEICDLPNHISIPLLYHLAKLKSNDIKAWKNNLCNLEIKIPFKVKSYISVYHTRIGFFQFIYFDHSPYFYLNPNIYGKDISYTQFKEVYDNFSFLDKNQFILTYGKDPFNLKDSMYEISSKIKEPVFEEIKNVLLELSNV